VNAEDASHQEIRCASGQGPLRGFLLASGPSTEEPDREADCHAYKDDLGDQEEETRRDSNEREEENQQHFPQQDSDDTRGGYAENGLQNGQAPVEAGTLRQFMVKSVTTLRKRALVSCKSWSGPLRAGLKWSWGWPSGSFAFIADKLISHQPATPFFGEHKSGMNAPDGDDTPAWEALTLAFMVLMNYRDVRSDEAHLRCLFAYQSGLGVPGVGVEKAEKCLNRIGPRSAAAECINPHRVRSVDRALRARIAHPHGLGAALDHAKNGDAVRGAALPCQIAGECQYENKDGRWGTHKNLQMRAPGGVARLKRQSCDDQLTRSTRNIPRAACWGAPTESRS